MSAFLAREEASPLAMEASVGPAFNRMNSASNSLPSRDVLVSRVIAPLSQIQDQPLTLTTASFRVARYSLGCTPVRAVSPSLTRSRRFSNSSLSMAPLSPLLYIMTVMDWGTPSFQCTSISPRDISPILIAGFAIRSWVLSLSTQPPDSPLKYFPNKSGCGRVQNAPDFKSGAMSPAPHAAGRRQQAEKTERNEEINRITAKE